MAINEPDHNHEHVHGESDYHSHGHGEGHSHVSSSGHSHDHGSSLASTKSGRQRLLIALGITASIFVAEVIGSWLTESLALLVDAGHMLTDTAGLLIALIAAHFMGKPVTKKRPWGYRRVEVIAAGMQALVLLAVGIYALIEGVNRISEPVWIPSTELLIFGVIGLIGNLISIAVLVGGQDENLNMKAAFLEVVNDALGSVAVIISAIVISVWGFTLIDTIVSLLIAILIMPRSIRILKKSFGILMEETPKEFDSNHVIEHLMQVDHVQMVHDLHISQIGTKLYVLTAHVVLDKECFENGDTEKHLKDLQNCVASHLPGEIHHSTIQLESPDHAWSEQLGH